MADGQPDPNNLFYQMSRNAGAPPPVSPAMPNTGPTPPPSNAADPSNVFYQMSQNQGRFPGSTTPPPSTVKPYRSTADAVMDTATSPSFMGFNIQHAIGMGKDIAAMVNTGGKLIQHLAIPELNAPGAQPAADIIPAEYREMTNSDQRAGAAVSNVAQFMLGDEELKLIMESPEAVASFMAKNPALGKAVMTALRQGGLQTAIAAAHGEGAPEALKQGAITGATGGILGGVGGKAGATLEANEAAEAAAAAGKPSPEAAIQSTARAAVPSQAADFGEAAQTARTRAQSVLDAHAADLERANAQRRQAILDFRESQRAQSASLTDTAQEQFDKTHDLLDQQQQDYMNASDTHRQASSAYDAELQAGREQDAKDTEELLNMANNDKQNALSDFRNAQRQGDQSGMAAAKAKLDEANDIIANPLKSEGANAAKIADAKDRLDAARADLMDKQNPSVADKIATRRQAITDYQNATQAPGNSPNMLAAKQKLDNATQAVDAIRTRPAIAQARQELEKADTLDELHDITRKSVDGIQDAQIAGRAATVSPINGAKLLKGMNQYLSDPEARARVVRAIGQDGLDNIMHVAHDHATLADRAQMGTSLDTMIQGLKKYGLKEALIHSASYKFRLMARIALHAMGDSALYGSLRLARNADSRIAGPILSGMLNPQVRSRMLSEGQP